MVLISYRLSEIIAYAGPVSQDDIIEAEKEMGLMLAGDYREYLKELGFASFEGHELTGISKFQRLNVVNVTFSERKKNPSVANDMYVIEETNIDGIVVWQDSAGKVYQTSSNTQPVLLCGSLKEYIAMV